MTRKWTFFLILLVSSILLSAQTKSVVKSLPLIETSAINVGVSQDRLNRIDKMCEEEVAKGNLPGMVALVARNGKIIHWKAYGLADNESGKKMERDAIFRIASQTKAITATAVMMLWEEGKFRLDDPISKYIPEFKNPQVLTSFRYRDTTWVGQNANSEITIRHLLTHTSGIAYGEIDPDERFKMIFQKAGIIDGFCAENIKLADNIKKLAKMPLHHNPGEKYTYSEGLDVLGYFIEIISGMPFNEFLKTHIFDPLGMDDTRFYLPDEKANRLVSVQHKENGKWKKFNASFFNTEYPIKGAKTYFAGGAGLSSTAKDYATFLQMYLNKGEYNGVRLLSENTVKTIMSNQFVNVWDDEAESYYGLAFSVTTEKGSAKGANGNPGKFNWGGYFNTQYFADPHDQIIGIIMKQTQGPVNDVTGWKFQQLVFQLIDK